MNYRKFYKETTGVEIPKGFDVHHIDGYRNNNDISNLVAIPKKIHNLYHQVVRYNFIAINIDIKLNPMSYNYSLDRLTELSICTEIIHYFVFFRDALIDGKTSSIMGHNYESCFKYLTNKINL